MSIDKVTITRFSEAPLAFVTEQIEDDIIDGVCREVEAALSYRSNSLHLRPRLHSTFDTFNEALSKSRLDDLEGAETLRTAYIIDLRKENNPYVARVLFCITRDMDSYGFTEYVVDCIITYAPRPALRLANGQIFRGLSGHLVKVRVGQETPFPYYW